MNQCTKPIKKTKQKSLEQHLCNRNIGRAITLWGEIEKTNTEVMYKNDTKILRLILWGRI